MGGVGRAGCVDGEGTAGTWAMLSRAATNRKKKHERIKDERIKDEMRRR
jgi:hypothetical protein